ncbi:cysteine desulfurase NifS [Candidatus Wolfebacteria bacterium CG02_land_8_20_14_3_00_37_12]|uniref:cysteine desulfurase n=1 Tax=Candidatus Wolfebacteria bacterium CG02_land_8_20_14_3_00_37_12 TaxID=1975066 RepID=A0A2M7CPW9_9BACT|nr:MAG: cysteine desulfurase NifS [Candidatus Wolfebacteria bacterium CG02_land_8_20_14_3_00_37_12]
MLFIMKRIYLDYAATTPMDMKVKKAMAPYFSAPPAGGFGNPGSLHFFGQKAMTAVDESREKIAKAINADFREIIFTGSATEANNLALRGIVKKFKIKDLRFKIPRIIVSAIEHDSILETCRDLEREEIEIIYLPVNKQGIIDLKKLKESLNERTVLVSIMCANNEIGIVQNIAGISKIIKDFKKENFFSKYPLFHTDAVQAFQFLDCDVNKLGVDLMTLSAHKIYGPKGIGTLYINSKLQTPNYKQILNSKNKIQNKKTKIWDLGFGIWDLPVVKPLTTGGGQEFGLRSGTENVAAIVGFAKAIELVSNSRELENKRVRQLTDYFWRELKKLSPKAEINGLKDLRFMIYDLRKLPNILNVYFPNQNSQDLLIKLDLNGIAVSSGSACSARATKPSHVLKAIGLSDKKIKSSLRFSLGKFTTKEEINRALKIIKKLF